MQPAFSAPKDYAEMSKLLAERGGRRGPGQYADGLNRIYSISRNPLAGSGVRYEDGDWGKKRARKPRHSDPAWKTQHLLAGSLHRLKSKQRPSSAPRQRQNGGIEDGSINSMDEEQREEGAKKDESVVEDGSTENKKRKPRPKSAQIRRRPVKAGDESLQSISRLFKSSVTTSFGPGFGSPLRTPIKKWRQPNRINYLRTNASTSDILNQLAQSDALKKAKKKAARPKHRRRITPAVATAGIDAENGKKELTAQQMIRRLPKYYDPKKDPAMMPVKNIRGGGFAPVTCLNGRQQKILELAKAIAPALHRA